MILTDYELYEVVGGATQTSSSLINSISKLLTTILDIGRALGSSLRYAITGKKC